MKIDDLDGRLVLVMGASTGIGAAVSRAFAEQGARVAIHYNDSSDAARELQAQLAKAGGKAVLVQGDLSQPGVAKRVVEESAEALGGLDVLINNAGSLIARRPFLEMDDAFVDSVFDLNVRAVMQLNADTPPMFLLCGADDQPAISQGVADLYLALRRAGVSAELHVYAGVGHGFGLRPDNSGPVAAWPQQFLQWLGVLGLTASR